MEIEMIRQPKIVKKPWGQEMWLSDGTNMPYAFKRIVFNSGHKSSLQVHQFKKETNHVLRGSGVLITSSKNFPVDEYLKGKITDLMPWLDTIITKVIMPGDTFDIMPGIIHRIIATTEIEMLEASTTELDDVIRLQDDTNRPHGKINSEHA